MIYGATQATTILAFSYKIVASPLNQTKPRGTSQNSSDLRYASAANSELLLFDVHCAAQA